MAFPILGTPKPQFFDSSGSPLVSGTLSILEPADDTNKAYYPTADDADAATNSSTGDITLDTRGEPSAALFGIDDQKYKLVLKDSAAATIWTVDDIRVPSRLPSLYGSTAQTLTDAGAVTLTESTTFVVTTTAAAITLADGVENQHKLIVMKTDAGAATLTPTNLSNGTTIVFDDVGDSADLWFVDGSWNFMGGTATVTGEHNTEVVTSFTNTLTASETGKTIFLNLVGGGSTVLPTAAAGLSFTFIVTTAPTTAYTIDTPSGANIMSGVALDIVGELVYATARDIISFVASTSLVGDRVDVISDGTNWYYTAFSGADGGITTGQT